MTWPASVFDDALSAVLDDADVSCARRADAEIFQRWGHAVGAPMPLPLFMRVSRPNVSRWTSPRRRPTADRRSADQSTIAPIALRAQQQRQARARFSSVMARRHIMAPARRPSSVVPAVCIVRERSARTRSVSAPACPRHLVIRGDVEPGARQRGLRLLLVSHGDSRISRRQSRSCSPGSSSCCDGDATG